MQKIQFTIILVLISSLSAFAQYKMEISANYNIPSSSEFSDNFDNGIGAKGEIHYYFENTGFSTSILLGVNSFRGTKGYEQELEDRNPTLFEYDYEIHYFTIPVMFSANYTFFRENKFNLVLGLGAGVQFMELKEKQIGKYTSDTQKESYNEFAMNESIELLYNLTKDIAVSVQADYNNTFGDQSISYYGFSVGLLYKI